MRTQLFEMREMFKKSVILNTTRFKQEFTKTKHNKQTSQCVDLLCYIR